MRTLTDVCQNSRCNKVFSVDGIGRKRRFCCDACKQQAHRESRRPAGMARRKSKVEIPLDAFERLIVDLWLVDAPAASVALEFAYNRLIPINHLWIESEVERRQESAAADRAALDRFLDAMSKPPAIS